MLINKEKFDNCITIKARMHSQKQTVIRRFLMAKDSAVFSDFVDSMEKLFGIKFFTASFYYIDLNGERVTFSSDEELAIAMYLSGENELKIGMEEFQPTDGILLKVENPSSDSSIIMTSLDSSLSQHSTPTLESRQLRDNRRRTVARSTGTPTMYKSKIVPKITRQWCQNNSCIKSSTFIKKEPNIVRISSANNQISKPYELQMSDNEVVVFSHNCADGARDDSNSLYSLYEEEDKADSQCEEKQTRPIFFMKCENGGSSDSKRTSLFKTLRHAFGRFCAYLFPLVVRAVSWQD